MNDIITLLKQERLSKPSLVSFRNLGAVGHSVTVRRIRAPDPQNNRFEWSYLNQPITENYAQELLMKYKPNKVFNRRKLNFSKYLKEEPSHV